MSKLKVENAELFYEVIGEGPMLLFIPGANGTGNIFAQAAQNLKDSFTVVMYDRRNYGKSILTTALSENIILEHDVYRIKQDAQDINSLVKAISKTGTATIIGSSSGSIAAMEALQDFPEIFDKAIFHESPINVFLPKNEQEEAQADNREIVALANTGKVEAAMNLFAKTMNIGEIDKTMMAAGPQTNDEMIINAAKKARLFWMNYEIRQYTSRKIDLNIFKNNKIKSIFLIGNKSYDSFPVKVMKNLSSQVNIPIYEIAGGHLGYAQMPKDFANTLRQLIER